MPVWELTTRSTMRNCALPVRSATVRWWCCPHCSNWSACRVGTVDKPSWRACRLAACISLPLRDDVVRWRSTEQGHPGVGEDVEQLHQLQTALRVVERPAEDNGARARVCSTMFSMAPTAASGWSNSMLCPLLSANNCWLLDDNSRN